MAKNTKADIYSVYLDRILAGEEDIGPVEDEEIEKLLLLAKTMIAADLSVNSRMRESLRDQLLGQVSELVQLKLNIETSVGESTPTEAEYEGQLPLIEVGVIRLDKESSISVLLKNDDELDDEDLDYISAAFAGDAGEYFNICPYCGSRLRKNEGKCSFCSH